MEDQDIVREFLLESTENLARLDQEVVELERRPKDAELLASIFRTIHTIKGTCGFLGFSLLGGIAHQGENILSQLRSGRREVNENVISIVLESVDAIKAMLHHIEESGTEGPDQYSDLRHRLERTAAQRDDLQPPEQPEHPESARVVESEKAPPVSDSAIRVDVGLLDKLMNLVGELVLARNQVLQFHNQREDPELSATSQRLNLITTELQEGVMKTRMQPIGLVWNKLRRLVRDLSHTLGKQVRLEMDGADTELDKTIIEAIKDPLTHLVRNSCDHGLERPEERVARGKPAQGTITLRAYHEGGQVNIEISDNGGGVDVERLKRKAIEKSLVSEDRAARMTEREALNLIFLPGFSTAPSVTDVSGRGVGMDVVKSNIEKIGGAVDIATQPGHSTTVRLKIPLTLAIIPGLVVTSGAERFVIPQVSLLELIRLDGSTEDKIEHIYDAPVYRRRGALLPIAYLDQILGLKSATTDSVNIVVLQADDRQFGLVVDGVHDTQEIVVKPLAKQLKSLAVYAGATIMGDGKVALILDALAVGRQSGILSRPRESQPVVSEETLQGTADQQHLLLFRTTSLDRLALPLSLVSRLEKFPQSSIEQTGDRPVVQYRGAILPLLSLESILAPGSDDAAMRKDPVQVVVIHDGGRQAGLVVDRIVDVVEETVTVRQQSNRPGLLGSAVVGKQVTAFVNLKAVLTSAFANWFESGRRPQSRGNLLLVEPSPFVRGILRAELEMAGYRIHEAKDAEEALERLDRGAVDLILTAVDLPGSGFDRIMDAAQGEAAGALPVIALTEIAEPAQPAKDRADDCQNKFDHIRMLHSIGRLAAVVAHEEKVGEPV